MFSFRVARSAPDLKEVSGARDAWVCEQSAVVYPQSAKIQLFVGIGKRCPAHVGSSESEKEDVSKLGCSMRRSFCIDELLYRFTRRVNKIGESVCFQIKIKTRKLNIKSPVSPLSSWTRATLCRCTVERCTNLAAHLPVARLASSEGV